MSRTRQILVCFAIIALVGGVALAHMKVSKTMPENGATLGVAPKAVQVWYTQEPDPAVSKLELTGPEGEVELYVHPATDKSLMGMVQGEMVDGSYVVSWQTAGEDGHIQKGEFSFTVKHGA